MRKSKASEVQRVAKDIVAIRAALHQYGYRTRKSHKQPVWVIFVNAQCSYLLTYQPAPISSWVLNPQFKAVDRRIQNPTESEFAIESIIQYAIQRRKTSATVFRG